MELILPIIFITAGFWMVLYPKQIGLIFSKLGRMTWKIGTLGFTDMRWLYPKDGAPEVFRLLGFGWVIIGFLLLFFVGFSFFGPNSFAAMREAKSYLRDKHGKTSSGYSISTTKNDQDQNSVFVGYRYGEYSGSLIGTWNGSHYEFAERPLNTKGDEAGQPATRQ